MYVDFEFDIPDTISKSKKTKKLQVPLHSNKLMQPQSTLNPDFFPNGPLGFSAPLLFLNGGITSTPISFFNLFFTDDIVSQIALQTNKYHKQKAMKKSKSMPECDMSSHSAPWKETNVSELRAFIGMVLATGILRLPQLSMYWSRKWLFNASDFASIMSRDRFDLLWWNIHLVNNAIAPKRGS